MDKKNIKFNDTELKEQEFYQSKSPVLIKDMDIIKQYYLISFLLVNKISNISLVTKVLKRLDFSAYSVQTWTYIGNILIKLNGCILW